MRNSGPAPWRSCTTTVWKRRREGEITLVLAGTGEETPSAEIPAETVAARAAELLGEGVRPREVVRRLVEEGLGARNAVYGVVMKVAGGS